MGNTTGQGHKGISHPFGGKHDAQPWREAYLDERMYPQFVNKLAEKDPAIAADVRRARDAEAVNYDLSVIFSEQIAKNTQKHNASEHPGWVPYTPALEAPIPYCTVGMRHLEGAKVLYGLTFGEYRHGEHQQVICYDGQNFGLAKSDSSTNNILIERTERLHEYIVSPVHYRKDIILKAKQAIDKEWEKSSKSTKRMGILSNYTSRYNLAFYNCQHYVRDILKKAQDIADNEHVSLVINSVNDQN